ncbi:hypothetical protein NKG94_45755 [Micromonospora sp. M12]
MPTRQRLAEAEAEYHSVRARMIALQEELDWEVYRLYGLIDEDLTCANPPELALGSGPSRSCCTPAGRRPSGSTGTGPSRLTGRSRTGRRSTGRWSSGGSPPSARTGTSV